MVSSPLVLGFNMSNVDQMDRVWPIITNKEAISIDHAWAGMPGTLYKTLLNQTVEVWAKALPESKVAILVLNTVAVKTSTAVTLALANGDFPGNPQGTMMRDVWNQKDVPVVDGRITLSLSTHASMLLVLENATDPSWWVVKG
jgi:hypothetical protein